MPGIRRSRAVAGANLALLFGKIRPARRSAKFRSALAAADEVVWSCYHSPCLAAAARSDKVRHGAAPLAFIDPQYSPAAVEADKPPPANLELTVNVASLEDVKKLPIPLLRLPTWCVNAPWWLIYVAHETGHHLQHDLGLIGHFRRGMEAAARVGRRDFRRRFLGICRRTLGRARGRGRGAMRSVGSRETEEPLSCTCHSGGVAGLHSPPSVLIVIGTGCGMT